MTDGQIARPSLARFRLPCGSTAIRPARAWTRVCRRLAPAGRFCPGSSIADTPTDSQPHSSFPVEGTTCQRHVKIGRRVRRAPAISRRSLRGGRRRTWQPFAAVERGRQAGGILRFLQTSLTSCSAERGRRAAAAIAYEGSLTIAQPLQPRPALMGRGVSCRTECRPRTPKPLPAKLLPPKLLLPMCFPAYAFYRVA